MVVDTAKDVATALISARDAISKAGAAFTQSGRVMCDSIKKYYLKKTASETVEATSGAMMSVLNYFWNDKQEEKKKQGKKPLPNDIPKHVGNVKTAIGDKKIDEAIIDYVNPSKLAQMYVMIAEGESTINAAKTSDEDIYKQHLQNVDKSIKGVIDNLQLKVTKYQYEKKLLYA
ncbi:MAG: hypothetical protein AAF944_08405 [Bacteroidota bacterium]